MTELRRTHFPYCIQEVIPGWFVILNRNYKPLGYIGDEWVDYHDYMVKIKGLGPATAKRISCNSSANLDYIMLYDDGCVPTRETTYEKEYFERLSKLLRLKIDDNAIKPAKSVEAIDTLKEVNSQIEEKSPKSKDWNHYKFKYHLAIKLILGILRSIKQSATLIFS